MALVPLGNPLTQLDAQNYVMNLRSQDASVNDVTWSATTQYFINDMVRGADGGLYVYEAWNKVTEENLAYSVLGGLDPSLAGPTGGWSSAQGDGLKTVVQNSGSVTGVNNGTPAGAQAAGAVTVAPALNLLLADPLGVVSTWLVKLDYTATLTGAGAFAAAEHLIWTVTPNGTAPTARVCTHSFGSTVTTAGSAVSVVVNLPANGTSVSLAGNQSGSSATIVFAGVVATYARLS